MRIAGFTDETKYLNMIKNRPAASLIPTANLRVISQRRGFNFFGVAVFGLTLLGISLNQYREVVSLRQIQSRKKFEFTSDPYSGAVHCTYNEVPYKQCGY